MGNSKSIRAWLGVTLLFVLGLALPAEAQVQEIKSYRLKNGMKVIVQEDRSIPNVALYIFYRMGSRNERPGTTGLSHFFEHMMFNGAKNYGPGEFDRVMEANGGSKNAYTSFDVTVYQDWFPRSALELIFELEADRIRDLAFDAKVVESERGVVASERRTGVDNNNLGVLSEQLWAAAYTAHPYQWPIVGWMVDIENWKMEDLKRHFAMGYSPSNATMAVVDDAGFDEIVKLAEKHIEPIPSHDPPPQVTTKEPEQLGERRVVVKKFAQLPLVTIGYHVPETASPDHYALRVLQTILFSGQSSRMYQRVVDKDQLALSVFGDFQFAFDPTLFTIIARPPGGDETSLGAITRDDIIAFYEANYAPGNVILAVVGDFHTAEMEQWLAARFGDWPAKTAAVVKIPEPAPVTGKRLLLVDKPDSTQTYYRIGNLGIARTSADRVQIDVVNTLFGGRFTSMLNTALRIETGLTYGAGSFFDERRQRGPFVISTYTRNATTEKAIDMTMDMLRRLHEKGITEAELKSAKNYLKGQFPPQIETTDQLASAIAELELFGLDAREIDDFSGKVDAMTLEDARRIIKQYFPSENLVFVLVGKASEIESVAKKYAPQPDRKFISQPGF